MKAAYLVFFLFITIQFSCPSNCLRERGDKKISDAFMDVPYCELIRNPSAYDGRKVRIAATYRSGYEWSEIYDRDCFDFERRTWVEFENLDAESRRVLEDLKTESSEGRTLSVIFAGTFENSKGNYGHLNDYKHLLKVSNVDRAELLFEGSKLPTSKE